MRMRMFSWVALAFLGLLKVVPGLAAILLVGGSARAQEASLGADEVMRRSHEAFYYAGDDMRAKVLMRLVNKEGKERIRELVMLRKDMGKAGEQRYYMYFHQPSDVRRMTFMVYKHPGKDDERWLFVPAINLVRRIAADDRRSSFVGSDFTYEDVSGRDPADDAHKRLNDEAFGGRPCYVVESTPKDPKGANYGVKRSWIDPQTFLPLKEEYADRRGELARVFTADEVAVVGGFPTVTRRTMADAKSGHRTVVTFQETSYDVGLDEALFTERYLREPPQAQVAW